MSLPVEAILGALGALGTALSSAGAAVLVAPPGSGKTTVVPTWLLDSGLAGEGEVLVLQPRRVAARSVARFVAAQRGEPVGQTVGYQVRHERKVSATTRVRFITEGILTAWLQRDPALEGVGAVILDEFHERSVHADLGLCLLKEVREAYREDLRILVMSATLAAEPVAAYLGGAPIVRAEGRAHPVELMWLEPERCVPPGGDIARVAARGALDLYGRLGQGDVLVFLPGVREITACVAHLQGAAAAGEAEILPLHGRLPPEAQDLAVRGCGDGRRRIIVSTNVAETSLTIPGIRAVVDAGLARVSRFDPAIGSTRLELERISRASATQRAGRAGRLGPGVALRLWSRLEDERLREADEAEIHRIDPAAVVLELKRWGVRSVGDFDFFEAPSPTSLAEAEGRLGQLGALAPDGSLSAAGAVMAELPREPRAAATLLLARALPERSRVALTLAALAEGAAEGDLGALDPRTLPGSVSRTARQLEALVAGRSLPGFEAADVEGAWIAGHLDRVAVRRDERTWQLPGGRRARAPSADRFAIALSLEGGRRGQGALSVVRAWLPLTEAAIEASPGYRVESAVAWDDRAQRVVGQRQRLLGALVLEARPEPLSDRAAAARLLVAHAEPLMGRLLEVLEGAHGDLLGRWRRFAALWPDPGLPATTESLVRATLPALCRDLSSVDALLAEAPGRFRGALAEHLPHGLRRRLDELLPEGVTIPSGRQVKLRWEVEGPPILAARVQELFGWEEVPRLGQGRVPVLLHLLDPGGKPLQVTQDLRSFWRDTWRAVRAEMRTRYPKHHWPEDPLGEEASTRTTARAYRRRS